MATQADIDALTAEVTSVDQAAQAGFAAITTEVQALESNGVDVTALKAAIDQAQTDVTTGISNVTSLVPAPTPAPGA